MVIKYKLTISSTENRELHLTGNLDNIVRDVLHAIQVVYYDITLNPSLVEAFALQCEEKLKQWAERNNGEIEKVFENPMAQETHSR